MKEKENRQPALSNGGALSLTFIGAGSAFTKKFYQTNLLVVKGNSHLLVDCGTRCPRPSTAWASPSPRSTAS
jgi:hypothetical protein